MSASPKSEDPPTLDASPTVVRDSQSAQVDPTAIPLDALAAGERYELTSSLGRGGMGEVLLCTDRRLGRQVAMKVIRAEEMAKDGRMERFLREARVQGQLEHPSVVPVHDLGLGPDQAPFFIMKRIRGDTLEKVIAGLASGDADLTQRYSRRKLLTAFSSVCLAIHFAHTRGIVHRDLKPTNIMLGDFGEVYVLDWGLAKPIQEPATATAGTGEALPGGAVTTGEHPLRTLEGAVMGTPGYMAPEQVTGDPVDARTDVYALGAILFDLLALQSLIPASNPVRMMQATLDGVDVRARLLALDRDIPPELVAACAKATAVEPAARYPNVHALYAAVEAFLEGERDVELRAELARAHASRAESFAEQSLRGGASSLDERRRAMREVGRALALDPENPRAFATLFRLLGELPKEPPPEVKEELAADSQKRRRLLARVAMWSYAGLFLYIPVLLWMGVRSWTGLVWMYVLIAACTVLSFITSRTSARGDGWVLGALVTHTGMMAVTSLISGPFIVLPSFAASTTMLFAMHFNRKWRPLVVGFSALALIIPSVLMWTGRIPTSYVFDPEGMRVVPSMVELRAGPTWFFLFVASLVTLVGSGLLVARMRDALTDAQERLFMQAWNLRQLLPEDAPRSTNLDPG